MNIESWVFPALLALCGWGITIFLPKLLLRSLSPLHLIVYAAVWFFLIVLGALPFMPPLQYTQHGAIFGFLAGITGMLGQVLFYVALTRGPLNIVSMITALYPVLAASFAFAFMGEELNTARVMGIGVGSIALLLLVWSDQKQSGEIKNHGWMWPAVGALVIWGFWALLPKFALKTLPPESVIFYEALGGMAVALPILAFLRFKLQFELKPVLLTGFSSVISLVAILSYLYALAHGPVTGVVMTTALYPVVTILLAWVVLKERLTPKNTAGIIFALSSIILLAA